MLLIWSLLGLHCAYGKNTIIDLPAKLDARYDLTWEMTITTQTTAPVTVDIERVSSGRGFRLAVHQTSTAWYSIRGGAFRQHTQAPLTLQIGVPYQCTVKRRAHAVAFLINSRLITTMYLPTSPQGTAQVSSVPTGCVLGEVRYQSIVPTFFQDDFMREEALAQTLMVPGAWHEDATWEVGFYRKAHPAAAPVDPRTGDPFTNPWQASLFPAPNTSVNGFWWLYTGTGPSWVIPRETLMPSWSDQYLVQVAVRADQGSTAGVLFAYHDPTHYMRFRIAAPQKGATATPPAVLEAVIGGETLVLATASTYLLPGQWASLRIGFSWHRIQVWHDEILVCDVANPGSLDGRIGLYADAAMTSWDASPVFPENATLVGGVCFDDVCVSPWEGPHDLTSAYPGIAIRSGRWTEDQGGLTARSTAQIVTCKQDWDAFTVNACVRLPEQGFVEFLLHRRGEHEYRWQLSPYGLTLKARSNAVREIVIDQSPLGLPPGAWHDVKLVVNGPYLACYVEQTCVFESFNPGIRVGQFGVRTGGAGVTIKSLHVTPLPQRTQGSAHSAFSHDRSAATWAGEAAYWVSAAPSGANASPGLGEIDRTPGATHPTSSPGLYWHTGSYYHDFQVILPFTPSTLAGQRLHLAPNTHSTEGFQIEFHQTHGKKMHIRLRQNDSVLQERVVRWGEPSRVVVSRAGGLLAVTLQRFDPESAITAKASATEQLLVLCREPAVRGIRRVGFTVTDPVLPAVQVRMMAYPVTETFEAAPVRWRVGEGLWSILARYACDPRWNWYGGCGPTTPVIWSKTYHAYDQTVEAYLSVKMRFIGAQEPYAARFRDLNVSICGDGENPMSGYTVIRGGLLEGKPATMLLKNGVVVHTTQHPQQLLPSAAKGHHQWFATRIEKQGNTITVHIDHQLAMTYLDHEPLDGGYVGIWTRNNGILVGRVDLAAEEIRAVSADRHSAHVIEQTRRY